MDPTSSKRWSFPSPSRIFTKFTFRPALKQNLSFDQFGVNEEDQNDFVDSKMKFNITAKPQLVEPIDYEAFVLRNSCVLHNDPQRNMLLYPQDDVSQAVLPRRYRTTVPSVPNSAASEASSLLVQECIRTYTSNWNVVHYKYSAYSGNYLQLPKVPKPDLLEEQVYEIDESEDTDLESLQFSCNQIIKQGFLLKGPETTSIIAIATHSFKRRFVYLRKGVDGTCTLEFHKDDRKREAKGTICLDFCTEVVLNSKRGKLSFELKMQDNQKSYILMAETESELEDWLDKLNQVILAYRLEEVTRKQIIDYKDSPPPTPENRGTLKSLEHSRNPELMKFSKETDFSIAQARKENRQNMFAIYPEMMVKIVNTNLKNLEEHDVEPYKEQFVSRVLVRCESIKFRLQMPLESERGTLCQVEPYLTTMALYDAKKGKKVSADFHFDVNHVYLRNLIPKLRKTEHTNGTGDVAELKIPSPNGKTVPPELMEVSEEWLLYPKQAVLSVTHPDSDIYLVIRIEKILQGAISTTSEPYIRNATDSRLGAKIHKNVKLCCQRLGHYRMPFAWTAKPLFKPFTREVDTYSDFFVIYKQDSSKLGDEDLLKFLADIKKPEKISRLTTIPCTIKLSVSLMDRLIPNVVTSSLIPVRPFPLPPTHDPTFEVDEFHSGNAIDSYPYTSCTNHLYVCPKSLKYDTQKSFTKARNIVCVIEFRDNDEEGSQPLKLIYGKPGEATFVSQATCAVVHHATCPDFYEEVKIALPTQLHDKHHVLFIFLHVSCDLPKSNKRREPVIENVVGYAWIPALGKGRMHLQEHTLPVASHLPSGYLSVEPFGLGRGFSGPEIRWVDNQKQLFRVDFRLVSTIYTKDQHLHNFFAHMQRMVESRIPVGEGETCKNLKVTHQMSKALKALHAVDVGTIIHFLPTLLNQLFRLLVSTNSEDVALNTVRVLVHIINVVVDLGKTELLHTYTKYVFQSNLFDKQNVRISVHEELVKSLTAMLKPANTDFLVVNKFLKHAWFFFQVLVKGMAQHLLNNDMIKAPRCSRFSKTYHSQIEELLAVLIPHVIGKYRELPEETKQANCSLAWFIKKCLTFMDRGFVFRLINNYMDKFNLGDPKTLQEYKFDFLQVITCHEHYISLNLPILRQRARAGPVKNMKEYEHEYRLSEEFCQNHFLVGLLLQEVRTALNEVRDIRRIAISVLRNLLAKHSFDDRYQNKMQQARVTSLYMPFITIILENLNRLNAPCSRLATPAHACNGSVSGLPPPPVSETPFNTPKSGSNRYIIGVDGVPVIVNQRQQRDSSYLTIIAGQGFVGGSQVAVSNASSSLSLESSSSTMSNASQDRLDKGGDGDKLDLSHARSQSLPFSGQGAAVRHDKLDENEVKDLLICFLYIVKNVGEDYLIGWWQQCLETDIQDFFHVLELCLHQFRYQGKRTINSRDQLLVRGQPKSMTLPARIAPPNFSSRASSTYSETNSMPTGTSSDADTVYRVLLEANMASEVSLICLDVLGLYCTHFKEQLLFNNGDNQLMRKIFDIYLSFLQVGQSEKLQRHIFAALRSFLIKFPMVLFRGNALLCGKLCYELLKNCNSKLSSTRNEACAILYLLMRSNFEFTGKKGLVRVHLQVIISVSQLLGDVIGLNNPFFQESLSIINNYANTDKAMQTSSFPAEVKDLTKRIRTVLMATTQMREHENDPEMLLDLQYSLANSYAATPELRKTWLETMAKNHKKNGNLSEAAHCYIHIAALVAEYLKQKGIFLEGCRAFAKLSPNVERDESGLKEDAGMQEMNYSEETLLELLERCAEDLSKAERYELIGDVYRIIIPIYENRRDYEALASCYKNLHNAYTKIVEVNRSGKRLLGKYYRVAFFGPSYFDEDSGKEYIYKEPKVTSLAEISERLYHLYCDKFGAEVVKMIMDSTQVDPRDLDLKYAYIQVTHVTPYFEKSELAHRPMEFDRNNNLQKFMFETPFTLDGKARSESLEQQCKRKTILRTTYSFPYVKKRIPIFSKNVIEMTPIEVAIEEMQTRVNDISDAVNAEKADLKKLQLVLQGSVSVQVNVGPLAYATAFLADTVMNRYPKDKVKELKESFRAFVRICNKALELNARLIIADQFEYHEALRMNFKELTLALSDIFHEKLAHEERNAHLNRDSLTLFSYISATSSLRLHCEYFGLGFFVDEP
uniref:Dedicator of cytokinesis protein 9 n=1 Tax=Strigamia maritima TaxID=126957 RepID=T1J4R8_STRMM